MPRPNTPEVETAQSLESWIWSAACSMRGVADPAKYKDYILPLVFTKRLCDVFDDELNRIAADKRIGSRTKAFEIVDADHQLVRFYLPLRPENLDAPTWSVIRHLSQRIGERLTSHLRAIAKYNAALDGIINQVDFNRTTHGQRDLDDDSLSNLIESISTKRLGLDDVAPDIIGNSYEYLIGKFAEDSGKSAGEFYTPLAVGQIMARVLTPQPGMHVYDPTCGSGGLLVKCQLELHRQDAAANTARSSTPLTLYGQESTSETWAMANMNMIIHDMQGQVEIGDTFTQPKFRNAHGQLRTFDLVVANPMWNQDKYTERHYHADQLNRFVAGFPGQASADWGWVQHIHASLNPNGRAAVVLDTGAASRGAGNTSTHKEKTVRQWFIDNDQIESVLYLPENLFYNTSAPGIVIFLNKNKPIARRNRILLVNASTLFEKGDPKNFIPTRDVEHIATTLSQWHEQDKLSRIIEHTELQRNDYNLSPSRYIHTAAAITYRPIAAIITDLNRIETEAKQTDKALQKILKNLDLPT